MSTPDPAPTFTEDEILEQAKGNASAAGLALLRYAREHGETPESAARWLGTLFAPGWEEVRGQGARQAAHWAGLNTVSLGATVRAFDGDERRADVTVAGWPGDEVLGFFGVSQEEADALFSVFATVADHIGLQYRWQRDGDAVTMTFEQGTS